MSSLPTRIRGARRTRGRHGAGDPRAKRAPRLARSLLALVFLGVHHVYTPFHLAAEDHLHAHGDHHAPCARAAFDGGPRSTHEPHPESDHSLTSGIPRAPAPLDLVPGLDAKRLVAALESEPRTRPAPVPLPRPRPPPAFSSPRPRAPPAA